jgi:hypothetical protein
MAEFLSRQEKKEFLKLLNLSPLKVSDMVAKFDHLAFKNDPELSSFVRPYIPGEFYPYGFSDEECSYLVVKVTQVSPGVRIREMARAVGCLDKKCPLDCQARIRYPVSIK